jgi:polysaccharide export outer membrane protein
MRIIYLIVSVALLSACASRQEIAYLQPSDAEPEFTYEDLAPRIQNEDLLTITVSAADVSATIPFNQINPYQNNVASARDFAFKPTYMVDNKGEIDFPVLGKVKLGGLTRMEATEHLRSLLKQYIVDAGVNLTFANFKVTVLGEVRSPGTFTLMQERITVLEALGLAGDMTIKGTRGNVLLVREKNGKHETHRLNLLTDSLLSSPYFYLAQNDVLYVEPNRTQVRASRLGQDTNVIISVTSLFITIVTLIIANTK